MKTNSQSDSRNMCCFKTDSVFCPRALSQDDIEELEEISHKLKALGNSTVKFKKSDQSLLVESNSRDLERLVLGNKSLYKESGLCRIREERYRNKKKNRKSKRDDENGNKSGSHRAASSSTLTSTRVSSHSAAGSGDSQTDTEMATMEQHHRFNSSVRKLDLVDEQLEAAAESQPINTKSDEDRARKLKKAHPQDARCEGCGNPIDFAADYDHIIVYSVGIFEGDKEAEERGYFYFHDTFCIV